MTQYVDAIAESLVDDLDRDTAAREELIVAIAWAIAGQLELGRLANPLTVFVPKSNEIDHVAALALVATAKLNLHTVVVACDDPRSWYAAALMDVDEIRLTCPVDEQDSEASGTPLQDQLDRIVDAVREAASGKRRLKPTASSRTPDPSK